jgi:DNA-binding Lrp family transcriptional regulator
MNLEELLESRPESTLFGFLLVAPPRSFSLFELSKRLGVSERVVLDRALSLIKHGYVKRFSKNGKTYLMLVHNHALFPQIRAGLLKNSKPYEDELFSAIKKLGTVDAAFLSGLFVGQPKLPVDVLLVGKVVPSKLQEFIENCERMMQQEINYSVMSVAEYRDRRNTFDRFIKDIFDYPHVTVTNKVII